MTQPRIKTSEPSPAQLRDLLQYEPDTGTLTWIYRETGRKEWNTRYAGKTAFQYSCKLGYHRGQVLGVRMLAHRAAWAIHYGETPKFIDHINRNPSDNRISNLRSVDHQTNMRNTCMRSDNTSGYRGVSKTGRGNYVAQIGPKGFIGHFDTPEEAYDAYLIEAIRLGFIIGGNDQAPAIAQMRGEAQAIQSAAVARGC